jgi:large subunit ribosomal protein L10Ae
VCSSIFLLKKPNMSKIPSDELRQAIRNCLEEKDKRKFKQTIDLQIRLRNYDAKRDKRFTGNVRLPFDTRANTTVCVLGDHAHCEKAKALGIPFMSVDDMSKLNKNKKLVKKLAKKYHVFLASESLIKRIPRILGPGLSKAGKFPVVVGPNDDLEKKVADVKKTIKFQFKKEICLGAAIGNVDLTEEQLQANVNMAVNYFVSLLKKQWQNVGSIVIKTTMGKPQHIYPPGQIKVVKNK